MGRSQRHLREIRHLDVTGYDARWRGWAEGKLGRPIEGVEEIEEEGLQGAADFLLVDDQDGPLLDDDAGSALLIGGSNA